MIKPETNFLPISDRRARCKALMRWHLKAGAEEITKLFDEMAHWPQQPANLDINSERWLEAEAAIDTAAEAGDMQLTRALCADYKRRVDKFCDHFRVKYGQKEAT